MLWARKPCLTPGLSSAEGFVCYIAGLVFFFFFFFFFFAICVYNIGIKPTRIIQ